MRFKKYLKTEQVKDVRQLLEATVVNNPKYGFGHKIFLKDADKVFAGFIEAGYNSGDIFEITQGDPEFELDLLDGGTSELLVKDPSGATVKIIGKPGKINGSFNHYKGGEGGTVFGRADTVTLETAQCLGFFLDGQQLAKDLLDQDKFSGKGKTVWSEKIKSVLGNGMDWDSTQKISKSIDGFPLAEWVVLAQLMAGCTVFHNEVSKKKINSPFIIHGKIDTYYKAEENNGFVETKGAKANTADMIVCSVPADDLITFMENGKVTYNKDGMCKIGKAVFYQVSLKKAKEGAQLGKFFKMVQQKYQIPRFQDLLHTALEESTQIDEGLSDFAKAIGNKVVNMSKVVFNKLTNLFGFLTKFSTGFVDGLNAVTRKQLDKDTKYVSKLLGIDETYLKEAVSIGENGMVMINEVKGPGLNAELKEISIKDQQKLLNDVNKRLMKLAKTTKKSKDVLYVSKSEVKKLKTRLNFGDTIKLFGNYVTLFALDKMFISKLGDLEAILTEIVDIQKEIFFGKTTLPLYKVYGAKDGPTDTHTYEYLGTAQDFIDHSISQIKKAKSYVAGINSNAVDGNYYAIETHMVQGMNEDGSLEYTIVRTGSNQGDSNFSFVLEGVKPIPEFKFKKKYGI